VSPLPHRICYEQHKKRLKQTYNLLYRVVKATITVCPKPQTLIAENVKLKNSQKINSSKYISMHSIHIMCDDQLLTPILNTWSLPVMQAH